MTVPKLVFADTETTALHPDRRVWEAAMIVRPAGGTRNDDVEHAFIVDIDDLDLGHADPMSLKISKFYERHPQMQAEYPLGLQVHTEKYVMGQVERMTRNAWIVGAVPNFDTEVLAARMRWRDICPAWHYHLVDVENIAAGALALPPPWGFDDILARFGLTYDEADRHTALGDARMARDVYDTVMAGTWRTYTTADAAYHVGTTLLCPRDRCDWEAAYRASEFPTLANLTDAAIDHDTWHRIHGPTLPAPLALVPPLEG